MIEDVVYSNHSDATGHCDQIECFAGLLFDTPALFVANHVPIQDLIINEMTISSIPLFMPYPLQ